MKNKIHIWDIEDINNKIVVNIDDTLKNLITDKIKSINKITKELDIKSSRFYEYFIWKKSFIPAQILFKIAEILNISKYLIEKSILEYKQLHVPRKNSVVNPNLPIIVNPYFTSVISHLFFDGSFPKDGKGTYYNQKNKFIMENFIEKTKVVFGDVSFTLKKDHRGVLKCRMPRIIGEISKSIYNIDSINSFDSRIPRIIFKMNNNHKIIFIITAIIDEGSVAYDGSIQFGVTNKYMIEDFKGLCKDVDLETTKIKKGKSGHYHLYIKSPEQFFRLYKNISKKYPLLSLEYKGDRLKKALEIKNKKFYYTKKFKNKRINLVIGSLKEKENSINNLAEKYLIPPRTLRRYMYSLIKENRVFRKKVSNEFIYYLHH